MSGQLQWKYWIRVIATCLIFVWVFQCQIPLCGGHGHSHDGVDHGHGHAHDHGHGHAHDHGHGHAHVHEEEAPPAAYKYSRQANEQASKPTVKSEATTAKPVHHHQDHEHEHEHHDHHHDEGKIPSKKTIVTNPNIWFEALSSTLLISAAPFFILFLIPLDGSKEKEPLLKVLLAFASGGLLGDAFLHLIPHALLAKGDSGGGGHGHSHGGSDSSATHGHSHGGATPPPTPTHGHSHGDGEFAGHDLSVGIWVLVGILTFLLVEKIIRIIQGGHGHSHSSSHQHATEQNEKTSKKDKDNGDIVLENPIKRKGKENSKDKDKTDKSPKPSTSKKLEPIVTPPKKEIKVAGYLNLAADFTHNFTDGLAIGASYLAGTSVGLVTTITILLHEVPHEIGDFAILIQSGCSKKNAILLQLTTAVGALSGTIVSLLAAGGVNDTATIWILPFTAGGFIYIATVSVIPELLKESTFKQSVFEVIALLGGVYMMVLIAEYE